MERQLWKAIVVVLGGFDKARRRSAVRFSDERIVMVFYWAVIHDRPLSWACQRRHWPLDLRRQVLPSSSTMSRRLGSPSVKTLLNAVERRVVAPRQPELFWMIDGKPLVIGGCSKDRQAGYGHAAGCKAKGYKLHALVSSQGNIAAWRIAPMNKDERTMAHRMLRDAPVQGYLVADSNFDSNPLHELCVTRGNLQLVTRRRYGPNYGLGHRKHSPGRLRSIAMLENPFPHFGERLIHDRDEIERQFGQLVNWGGGLSNLPAWVRTHHRVHRWVQAKLVLTALRRQNNIRTCVA